MNTRHSTRISTTPRAGVSKKFVLIIGVRVRAGFGSDGTELQSGMDSDEYRVWAMNNLLRGEARVISSNRKNNDNVFHIDMDCRSQWALKMNREVTRAGGVITDVYLDYFFLIPSCYRRFYGYKWLENLAQLQYTGTAYLPIPKGDSGVIEDADYPSQLVVEAMIRGGKFITATDDISRIPWCYATIEVTGRLQRLSDTRFHNFQVQEYVKGFVTITKAQVVSKEATAAMSKAATATQVTATQVMCLPKICHAIN